MRRKACLVLFILSFLLLFVSCGSSSERDKSNDSVSSVTSVEKKSESSESNESKKDDEKNSSSSKEKNSNESKESSESKENNNSNDELSSTGENNDSESSSEEETVKYYDVTIKYDVISYTGKLINEYDTPDKVGNFSKSTKVVADSNLKLEGELNSGYNFVGWYNGTNNLSNSLTYTLENINEDITIIAKFRPKNFSLTVNTLNSTIGNVSVNDSDYNYTYSSNVMYNSELTIKTDGDKELFDGWYIGGNKVSSDTTYKLNMPASAITIEARWNIFQVTYDLNGGDYNDDENITEYTSTDEEFVLKDPTYVGYDFDGWYDGDIKVEKIDPKANKNYSLKAMWSSSTNTKYTVVVVCNYGYEDITIDKYTETKTGTTGEETDAEYLDIDGLTPKYTSVTQEIIARDGSTVVSLYYKRNLVLCTFVFEDLYAGYIDNNGNMTSNNYFDDKVNYTITLFDGYTLDGVYDEKNNLVSDELEFNLTIPANDTVYTIKTVKNIYTLNTYQSIVNDKGFEVTFDSQGGSLVDKQYSNSLIYPYSTKEGALFRGWASTTTGTPVTNIANNISSDKLYYGRWYEQSDWYNNSIKSVLDLESITLGYVNGTFEVSQKVEYAKSYYGNGGWLVFTPLVTGKVKFYVSGYKWSSFNIYTGSIDSYYGNVDVNFNDKYYETKSNLTKGTIYYVQVDGYYGYSNYVRVEGNYPTDSRDLTTSYINYTYEVDGKNKLYNYADILAYKNQTFIKDSSVSLECVTITDSTYNAGYENVFIGWYDLDTNEYVSHDFNYEFNITKDINLEARYKVLTIDATSNRDGDSFTYVTNIKDFDGAKYGDELIMTFTLSEGLVFDEFEYNNEAHTSTALDKIEFKVVIDGDDIVIKLMLSTEEYSFSISGSVSDVTLTGTYNSKYSYLDEIEITLENNSGHTIKWYLNDAYYAYGDSVEVVIYNETVVRYELANIDIVDGLAYYGSYPQSNVTDETLISSLNGLVSDPSSYKAKSSTLPSDWIEYGYPNSYANSSYSGYQRTSVYADVTYKGNNYRAIYIYNGRQNSLSDSTYTNQSKNGYNNDTMYWFKYEPIAWDILEIKEDGSLLLQSHLVMDSQSYYWGSGSTKISHNGYNTYASSYAASGLRQYLIKDFYNLAFDSDNPLISMSVMGTDSTYDTTSTNDKVRILSRYESSTYGYDGISEGTDYALSQGYDSINSWVRGAAGYDKIYTNIGYNYSCSTSKFGVRPVINITI